jgi:hypothetical protein
VETSGSGSTILLLVAAALWLVYLVPLWMKRSEYYATERNAARLGQTIRLLANTTETSKEIKAELKARSIAKKEREAQRQLRIASSPALTVAERRRRTKQIFSLTFAVGALAGVTAFLAGWPLQVIWASSTVATFSFAILGRLNRVSQQAALAAPASRGFTAGASQVNPRAWTPTPVPEPRTAPVAQAEHPLPSRDELVRQARSAAVAQRPEEFEDEGLAVVSPFARMGEIEAKPTERLNLDEVLARRRAV